MDIEKGIAALRARQTKVALEGLKHSKRGDAFEYGVLAGRVDELLVRVEAGKDEDDIDAKPKLKAPNVNPYARSSYG
jgi:hypothetical protein